MEKWLALFLLGQFIAIFAWKYANAVLIDTLKRYCESSHLEAGAPDISFIAEHGQFNARWVAHVLFMRFRKSLPTTKYLGVPFWIAFVSGWYLVLGIALLALHYFGIFQLRA